MLDSSHIRLRLAGAPENVIVVRELLAAVAQPLELPDSLLEDIRTVVSEACNNVVMHAYEEPPGPMQIDVRVDDEALEVVVRDEGGGIRPHATNQEEGVGGIGLAVIQAFTDRVQLSGAPDEGTEVRMWFALPNPPRSPPSPPSAPGAEPEADVNLACEAIGEDDEATLSVVAGELLPGALERVAAALGARARLAVDRLSDVLLVVDALAAHAPAVLAGPRLQAAFAPGEKHLEMCVGPLIPDGSQALVEACAVAGVGSVLERLSEGVRVETRPDCEFMSLRLGGPR